MDDQDLPTRHPGKFELAPPLPVRYRCKSCDRMSPPVVPGDIFFPRICVASDPEWPEYCDYASTPFTEPPPVE